MIEIEVEMDSDVASAELAGSAEGISEEIARIQGAPHHVTVWCVYGTLGC